MLRKTILSAGLHCSLTYDLACLIIKVLLLPVDIETNPDTDIAQLERQLQHISENIREIKDERLASIEAKLERLS